MPITFLLVEKCCFYIPLETGVKFFGFLSLSGSALLLLFAFLELAVIKFTLTGTEKVMVIVNMAVQVIQSCTATLLLQGTYERKPELMPYWLISTPIVAILEFTLLANVTFYMFYIEEYQLEWYIVNSITMIDDVYGWVVAYSYYHTLLTPGAAPV